MSGYDYVLMHIYTIIVMPVTVMCCQSERGQHEIEIQTVDICCIKSSLKEVHVIKGSDHFLDGICTPLSEYPWLADMEVERVGVFNHTFLFLCLVFLGKLDSVIRLSL